MDDKKQGVYRKFRVSRADGSSRKGRKHAKCQYFVLDLSHDPFCRPALKAYAKACRKTHPELAREIRESLAWKPHSCGCREAMCPHTPLGLFRPPLNIEAGRKP